MNRNKMNEMIDYYKAILSSYGVETPHFNGKKPLNHCLWVLDRITELLNDNDETSALQWMGFVQGCFWCFGLRTFNELHKDTITNSDYIKILE